MSRSNKSLVNSFVLEKLVRTIGYQLTAYIGRTDIRTVRDWLENGLPGDLEARDADIAIARDNVACDLEALAHRLHMWIAQTKMPANTAYSVRLWSDRLSGFHFLSCMPDFRPSSSAGGIEAKIGRTGPNWSSKSLRWHLRVHARTSNQDFRFGICATRRHRRPQTSGATNVALDSSHHDHSGLSWPLSLGYL